MITEIISKPTNGFHIPPDLDLNDIRDPEVKTAEPDYPDLSLPDDLIDKFPDILQKTIRYASPLSDAPDEFLPTPFLAMIGALIGQKRYLKLGGITLYPVIWTVLFAASSNMRKSTVLSILKSLFKTLVKKWKKEHDRELSDWNARRIAAKENKEEFTEPEPKKKTFYQSEGFSDLTFWETLRDSESIISVPGEFTGLWTELTRSRNALSDTALQLFDAEDHIRRNTRMGGDIELENPVWNIAGATTISAFQRSLTQTERGSGMLQRILPVTVIERTKPYKAMTELPAPDTYLYNRITERIEELSKLQPEPMTLSAEANQAFTQWSKDLNARSLEMESEINDIGGYASRLNAYGLKFALIFQTLDNSGTVISGANMTGAIALCEWIFKHTIFMLSRNYIFNRFYADRLKLREILAKKGGYLSRTDLMNLSNFDKEQMDRAIDNEITAGRLEVIEVDTGARKRYEYRLLNGKTDV